jgi:glycosyltransferase involved in cell wall biosynthesis
MNKLAKRKRIVILINSLSAGGAEKQSLCLASSLRDNHDLVLVVFSSLIDHKYKEYINKHDLKVINLEGNILIKSYLLYKIVRKYKTEIIFGILYGNNIVASIIGWLASTPFIFGGFRGSKGYPWFKTVVLKAMYRIILKGIITNSYAGRRRMIEQGFEESRLCVIQNGIELKLDNDFESRNKTDTITIISVGRFDTLKDYKTALGAFEILIQNSNHRLGIEYNIIGYGDIKIRADLEYRIKEKGLHNQVRIIDNPVNIDSYYLNANVYLSTSLFEGFSNAIIEAMLHGLPVVASNVGDNERIVNHNVTGFLVNTRECEQFSKYLKILVDDIELREKMGLESIEKIKREFGIATMKDKYLKLIESL